MSCLVILTDSFLECGSREEAEKVLQKRIGRWNGIAKIEEVNRKIFPSVLGGIVEVNLEKAVVLFDREIFFDEQKALERARSIECFFENGGAIFIASADNRSVTKEDPQIITLISEGEILSSLKEVLQGPRSIEFSFVEGKAVFIIKEE